MVAARALAVLSVFFCPGGSIRRINDVVGDCGSNHGHAGRAAAGLSDGSGGAVGGVLPSAVILAEIDYAAGGKEPVC